MLIMVCQECGKTSLQCNFFLKPITYMNEAGVFRSTQACDSCIRMIQANSHLQIVNDDQILLNEGGI